MTDHTHDSISDPLNAWLDAFVQGRTGPPGNGDLEPVAQAAATFHHLARTGERYAAAARSPMAKRWEDVMEGGAIPVPTMPSARAGLRPAKRGRNVLRFGPGSGDMGTMAAILAVMLLVGAVFANLAPRGEEPGDDLAMAPGDATATPAANVEWLTPVDPAECTVESRSLDEIAAIMRDPGEWPERQYLPTVTADPADADAAAKVYRTWSACGLAGNTNAKRAVETPRLIATLSGYGILDPSRFGSFDEWKALNEELRKAYLPADPSLLVSESSAIPPMSDQNGYTQIQALDPRWIKALPDGRLVAPLSWVFPMGASETMNTYWNVSILFFAPDPTRSGAWAVDEQISTLCLADCEVYYDEVEASWWYLSPATLVPATPDASADAWMTPVGPDECTTDPRPEDDVATFFREPPALPERAYLPVGPVDPLVANGIAKTARMWIACDDPAHTAQQQAVESPWFIVDQDATRVTDPGNFATFAEWQAFTESLREAFITAEPASYVVFSDLATPSVDQAGASGIALTAQPQHAVSLPDGRIAMVTTSLLEDGFTPDNSLDGATFEVPVLIFVQDETQSGRWVVDELLTLCVAGCDEEYYDTKAAWWTSVATPVGSTPMASPSPACMATSWFIGTNPAPFVDDPALAEVPWMEAETVSGDVTVLGLQLYGAHPLPVGGVFPGNGMSADMIWVTSEYVSQLRVTARSIDDPNAPLVHIGTVPVGSRVSDTGMRWSSVMDLPSPGCWEIMITANPADGGELVVAQVTVLVVANPDVVVPPSTDDATPAG